MTRDILWLLGFTVALMVAECMEPAFALAQPLALPNNIVGVQPGGPYMRAVELEIASPMGPVVYRTKSLASDWPLDTAQQIGFGDIACLEGTIRGRAFGVGGDVSAWTVSYPARFQVCPLPSVPVLVNPVP
jgi:hypothetical protein